MLLSGKNIKNAETPAGDSEPGNPFEEHKWLECTSRYLFETKKIYLSDANIMKLEEQIVERNKSRGWPKLYHLPGLYFVTKKSQNKCSYFSQTLICVQFVMVTLVFQ